MKQTIIDIKRILPYLEKVNADLYNIYASLKQDTDNENQYAHWIYEIKINLDFIASSLTDENGNRFGDICKDGHLFTLLHLYEDSIQVPTKNTQEKLVIEFLINVCTEIIIDNGDGLNNRENYDYAFSNTRKFINHLVENHNLNNSSWEKNVWFELAYWNK